MIYRNELYAYWGKMLSKLILSREIFLCNLCYWKQHSVYHFNPMTSGTIYVPSWFRENCIHSLIYALIYLTNIPGILGAQVTHTKIIFSLYSTFSPCLRHTARYWHLVSVLLFHNWSFRDHQWLPTNPPAWSFLQVWAWLTIFCLWTICFRLFSYFSDTYFP